jgi:cytoskeletal protein CcmA (bactofilin family)
MTVSEETTVIGRSMEIRGELSGTNDLLIDGEVEGVIRLSGARLTVGSAGRVRATIVAKEVLILGSVEGEIRSTGRVELRSGSKFVGEIFAARIAIEDGAVLCGQLDPAGASEPPREMKGSVSKKISLLQEKLDEWLVEPAEAGTGLKGTA